MYSLRLSEMRPTLHARALFWWDHLFMHVLSLVGGPMSSPGGHWPIVCFFAKSWISMSMVYCSFANLALD